MARNRTPNPPALYPLHLSTNLGGKVFLTIVGHSLVQLSVDNIITPVPKTSHVCRGELAAAW
jgi:hypothetical protein